MTTRSKGSKLLQTDQHFYRSCILYEAICETPVEDAYERMKTVMPNVDFLDFDFWYYRFLNGNIDLDYDRSADPKTRGFSDMPIEVVENIVENLGLVDKLSSRKVCRNLRTVIDNQKSKFQNVDMNITITNSKGDHLKMAMEYFSSVITNPKWSFENIDICFSCTKKRIRQFNSMLTGHKIRVEKLKIEAESMDQVIDLIPIFDANFLESIDFGNSKIEQDAMEKLFEMDQWKNARELKLREFPVEWFQMENLIHCKKFEITNQGYSEDFFDIFYEIRDILFKSPIFEYCVFTIECEPNGFDDEEWERFLEEELELYIEEVDEVMGQHAAYDIRNRRYNIEGSDDYFEISCDRNGEDTIKLEIKRVRH
ncbi:unnamed protein product [Caenorhabditis brenneri]